MPKKQKDLTSFIEAGKRNLEKWKRANPSGGNLRHGVYSKIIRKRYSDKRTREGKALQASIDEIKRDVGPELDARQNIILALIRVKLIVIMQIHKYLETLPELVNRQSGKVHYIIEHTFPRYSAALVKLLDALYRDDGIRSRKIPNYYDIVQSLKTKAALRAPSSDPEEEGPPLQL